MANIKLPEGFTVDEKLSADFLGVMNDQKMSPAERAQQLIDLQAKAITLASEKGREQWNNLQTEWQTAVKADPEIGGDKLPPVLTRLAAALTTFGTDATRQAFDATGAGNNPEIIKFFNKMALALGEGQLTKGGAPGPVGKSEDAIARRLFPTMNQ